MSSFRIKRKKTLVMCQNKRGRPTLAWAIRKGRCEVMILKGIADVEEGASPVGGERKDLSRIRE